MQEIYQELKSIASNRPALQQEVDRSLDKRTLTLPGRWESAGAVQSDIVTLVKHGLDESYWDKYVSELRRINLEQVNQSAKDLMTPDKMLWVIVGDRAIIEQKIKDTQLGEVIIINAEGQTVKATSSAGE